MTWFTIRAKDDNTAEVLIYGDIGQSWYGDSITAKEFLEQLQAVQDKDLVVRINSYGGSVSDGLAIYNAIKRHPLNKTVEIDGVAMSSASLIAMAGDTVRMAENTMLMIHAPWGFAMGNAAEMREYADTLDNFAKAMAKSYAAKTGKSLDEMTALVTDGKDHYYSAEEAKDAGFIDEIANAAPPEEAARFREAAFARFRVPAKIAASFNLKEKIMPKATAPAPTPAADNPPANVTDIEKAAETRERARISARNTEIKEAFARFIDRDGVQDLQASCLADPDMTAEAARAKLLAKLGEGSEPIGRDRIEAGVDARDKRVTAMTDALALRMGHRQDKDGKPLNEGSNPFRGLRLSEMARSCLQAAGVKVDGMRGLELAHAALSRSPVQGAQTTSDFPVILENIMHKLVLGGFQAQPVTYTRFCRLGDVSDFRAWNRLVPGLIGNLDGVNEHGEYQNKNIPDAVKNPISATRKGNIIQVTPEVIVNDDIGYIQTLASSLGQAGGRAIERAAYAVLNSNPVLSDGVALFHATHGNLAGAGAVPSVATLDTARVALMSQVAPGADAEYLDISPAVAVVTLAQGGNTRVLVNAVYDPDTANKLQRPNMVNGIVKDIVESPRLTGTAWYLFADPNVAPVIEVVFLEGQRQPTVTEEVNFRTSGLAWKVELPFGVGAIDFRGGYKNPGA